MSRILRPTLAIVTLLGAVAIASNTAWSDTFRIEIDYMVTGADHSHKPMTDVVEAVQQMFACQGHTLIVDISDALPHVDVLVQDPFGLGLFLYNNGNVNSFGFLKDVFFDHQGQSGWHYCVFAHNFESSPGNTTGASGIAEINGDDLIVSLGSFSEETGTASDQAATLAHEFGHNLGLTHCGTSNCSSIGNFKINLPSVMSYNYQLQGVRAQLTNQVLAPSEAPFKNIDYSHGTMCTLNEFSLNEPRGTGMVGVDWDCNGSVGGIVFQDLDASGGDWCSATGTLDSLTDLDEWAAIQDSTATASPQNLRRRPVTSCITAEEVQSHREASGSLRGPALTIESCIDGLMIYLDPQANAASNGKCNDPFPDLFFGHGAATDDSILFAAPGTYTQSESAVLTKPITILSTGPAVFK